MDEPTQDEATFEFGSSSLTPSSDRPISLQLRSIYRHWVADLMRKTPFQQWLTPTSPAVGRKTGENYGSDNDLTVQYDFDVGDDLLPMEMISYGNRYLDDKQDFFRPKFTESMTLKQCEYLYNVERESDASSENSEEESLLCTENELFSDEWDESNEINADDMILPMQVNPAQSVPEEVEFQGDFGDEEEEAADGGLLAQSKEEELCDENENEEYWNQDRVVYQELVSESECGSVDQSSNSGSHRSDASDYGKYEENKQYLNDGEEYDRSQHSHESDCEDEYMDDIEEDSLEEEHISIYSNSQNYQADLRCTNEYSEVEEFHPIVEKKYAPPPPFILLSNNNLDSQLQPSEEFSNSSHLMGMNQDLLRLEAIENLPDFEEVSNASSESEYDEERFDNNEMAPDASADEEDFILEDFIVSQSSQKNYSTPSSCLQNTNAFSLPSNDNHNFMDDVEDVQEMEQLSDGEEMNDCSLNPESELLYEFLKNARLNSLDSQSLYSFPSFKQIYSESVFEERNSTSRTHSQLLHSSSNSTIGNSIDQESDGTNDFHEEEIQRSTVHHQFAAAPNSFRQSFSGQRSLYRLSSSFMEDHHSSGELGLLPSSHSSQSNVFDFHHLLSTYEDQLFLTEFLDIQYNQQSVHMSIYNDLIGLEQQIQHWDSSPHELPHYEDLKETELSSSRSELASLMDDYEESVDNFNMDEQIHQCELRGMFQQGYNYPYDLMKSQYLLDLKKQSTLSLAASASSKLTLTNATSSAQLQQSFLSLLSKEKTSKMESRRRMKSGTSESSASHARRRKLVKGQRVLGFLSSLCNANH